jgi:tripartite-type tricarboxylate transporter receptor subunit TctC
MAMPDVKEKLASMGFDPVASTPEEFSAWIRSEIPRWAKVIRDAKIEVQ